MIIKTFIEAPIDNNNYLLIDENSKEAALIDCSSPDIWNKIPKETGNIPITPTGSDRNSIDNISLKYILLTHGHFDHIAGIKDVKANVYMHKDDLNWVQNVNQFLPMFGLPSMPVPEINNYINDGDIIELGDLKIKVLYTPGHTPGGVCYLVEDVLFSGDTIFKESVGRCDLEGGDFNQLINSIESKIYTLPDETKIYPGHGAPTTVGWEKEHNSYL